MRGGDDGETDASIENQVDAIARDPQQGLADEVKDGAAQRMPQRAWHGAANCSGRASQLRVSCVPGPTTSWRTLRR